MRAELPADMVSAARNPLSRADTARPKRTVFSKGTAASTKLTISGPILRGGPGAKDSLGRITTVDLATASRNERERREQAIERRDSVTLVATRPAPQPPVIMPREAMKRAQTVKRKEVGLYDEADRPSLSVPVALTSSAQLSPGWEEVRRRSPKLGSQDAPMTRELGSSRPAPVPEQKLSSSRWSARPERPVIDTDARSSPPVPKIHPPQILSPPQIPSPPKNSTPSEISSPIQVTSLPQAPSPPHTWSLSQAVRPNPAFDKPLMPPMPPSPPEEHQQSLDPRMSILPRKNSVKTNIRPSRQRPPSIKGTSSLETTATQRRTALGLPGNPRATVMQRVEKEVRSQRQQTAMYMNDIEYSDAANVNNILSGTAKRVPADSQTQLQEKTRASVVHRPRPIPRYNRDGVGINSTQEDTEALNMSGHQRILSNGSTSTKRPILEAKAGSPSQLPPLPPIPKLPGTQARPRPNNTKSMTFDEKMNIFYPVVPRAGNGRPHLAVPPFPPSLAETDDESKMDKPDRMTKSSYQTHSVVEIGGRRPPPNARSVAEFNVGTETRTTSQAWLPPVPNAQAPRYLDPEGKKRRSSPVLPYPAGGMSMFVDVETDDGSSMRGGSVHTGSVHAAQHVKPCVARMTHIPRREDKEIMTVILDPSEAQRRNVAEGESWTENAELVMMEPRKAAGGINMDNPFHQRIGHECPTFSNRREKARSRKMPPPPPLLLRGASRKKNMVVIHASEPSPIEFLEEEYRNIRAGLEKLDRRSRESAGSEARKRGLLASLEKEMGMQEDHWREMQDGLRNSLSTTQTSSRRASVYEAATGVTGQGRTQMGGLLKPNAVAQVQLQSPTPPDTDESDGEGIASRIAPKEMESNAQPSSFTATMWQPNIIGPPPTAPVNLLWTPPQKRLRRSGSTSLTCVDMALLPRRARPTPNQPLAKLQSSSLWQKTKAPTAPTSHLWGTTAPIKQKTRPLTQRPARKSRRMTLLPDILESPKPLPDKRGTLGIFQFSWGERSDNASFDTKSNVLRTMPGTMTTGGSAGGRGRLEVEVEVEDYSESFFDEYDDMNDYGDYDGFEDVRGKYDEDDEDDEDFDETTLWEIASLLKVDKIPSDISLPSSEGSRRSSVIDKNMQDEDDQTDSIIVALDTASLAAPPPLPKPRPSLWVKPTRSRRAVLGLPQPSVEKWMRYTAVGDTPTRGTSSRRKAGSVESASQWKPTEPERKYTSLLWCPETTSSPTSPKQKSSLWVRPAKPKGAALGLPRPGIHTWMQYIVDRTPGRGTPKREDLTSVDSASLWKPAERERQHSPSMRTPGIAAPLPKASLWMQSTNPRKAARGLPRPDVRASMRHIAVSRGSGRGAHRQEETPLVKSSALWGLTRPDTRHPSLLWGPVMPKETTQDHPLSAVSSDVPHNAKTISEHASTSASKGSASPLRREYRKAMASRADWEAALGEATEASYPARIKPAFGAEQRWGPLVIEEPLALSKGSGNSSKVTSHLWLKPQSVESSPGITPLWQPGQTRPAIDFRAPEKPAAQRRRAPGAEEPLPVFSWQRMWRAQDVPRKKRRDWLDDSVNRRLTGIQLRY